jgi:hypothetical protein
MKIISLVLLMLVPACAAAQEAAAAKAESHGVSVVKTRWQKRVYNPALDEDPLVGTSNTQDLEIQRRETERANATRARLGRRPLPMPMPSVGGTGRIVPNEKTTYYLYEAKVVNTGAKKIRSLIWEYVLFDPETAREVGRHAFESKVGIGAGKSKGLAALSTQPPATVVDASKSDKESRGQFNERVDIQRVEYDDGTVWEREQQ